MTRAERKAFRAAEREAVRPAVIRACTFDWPTPIKTATPAAERERVVEGMAQEGGARIEATERQLERIRQREALREEARDARAAAIGLTLWGRGLKAEAEDVARRGKG